MLRTQFIQEVNPIQHKGQKPIHLQEQIEAQLNKSKDQKHIKKIHSCSDRQFIGPIIITVKKDQTFKVLVDSKKICTKKTKNSYTKQKPNTYY